MIGAGSGYRSSYWAKTLSGLVGLRVKVCGKGGRDITGTLALERDGLTVTKLDGTVLPMAYANVDSVQHPPPGEDGRA